ARRPFLGYVAAGGHQRDVGVGEIVVLQRLHLQRAIAIGHFGALRAARRERYDFVSRKAALFQDVEHFTADISGRTDDSDLKTHESTTPVLSASFGSNPPASRALLLPRL